MLGRRFNSLLAGAATALALCTAGASAQAQNEAGPAAPPSTVAATPAEQSAAQAVPVPELSKETTGAISPPATTTAAVDTAAADKLRELAAGKYDRFLGRKDRTGIETFYAARNFAPLWITNGVLNERAKAAAAYLARVDADGLEPGDYPLPQIKEGAEAEAIAETELKFTQTVLTFVRHAEIGRIHHTRVTADVEYEHDRSGPDVVLAKLAGAPDVAAALDGFQPQHPQYKALKAKLAELRGGPAAAERPRLADGPTLRYRKDKQGKEIVMDDPRVPLLRERLGLTGDPSDTAYTKALADAVAKFQKSKELPANGQLNSATVQALNGPSRGRDADIIIVNMDRWRWMTHDLGKTYVMVNIPNFTLHVVNGSKEEWSTRIVVGKVGQATPIISAEMKFITVNPTWNVPPSIIRNEYLPAVQADPSVLDRMGLKMAQANDGTIRIWQPPGEKNVLGRIRFNFPNKFLVYQHDTPDKHLFAHPSRAYSHGCMRVQDPLRYGEVVLGLMVPDENYTQERLRRMQGPSEININFPRPLPVHLTYQTAFVEEGKLVIRPDIYGYDAKMIGMLKGSERRVADLYMERPKNTSAVPVRAPVGIGSYWGGWRGPSFFDALFGAAPPPPRPPARTRSANR